ncbi:MAG: TVP38/TMEM64 family protein [Candidatus Omnitrophota bacterium]|nr:TVP38/TMEM64 family protein [Candidatus Omnitrophota bacterium]
MFLDGHRWRPTRQNEVGLVSNGACDRFMGKTRSALIIKLVIGGLIVVAVWWLVRCHCVSFKSLTPLALRDYIRSFGNFAVFAYIIAYVLNTISIMPPIAALSLAAGLAFGKVMGAIYLMIGAMIGTSATFITSRYFGRHFIENMLKGRFKGLDEKLGKKGFEAVLFFRLIPLVPYEALNYFAGLSRIKFRDYFLASFLGFIPGVIIAAFFGGSLGEIKNFKDLFAPKFLIAAALMAGIMMVPVFYQIIRKHKARLE